MDEEMQETLENLRNQLIEENEALRRRVKLLEAQVESLLNENGSLVAEIDYLIWREGEY